MIHTVSVTSKGQVTIPVAVRQALGIKEGTKLKIQLKEDKFIAFPVKKKDITEYFGTLEGALIDNTNTLRDKAKNAYMDDKFGAFLEELQSLKKKKK